MQRIPTGEDFAAVKYFGIGLSRTGTTSLRAAMSMLGFTACHWADPRARRIIFLEDFLAHDASFDIPVAAFFEPLFHAFPNARFIYSERALDAWVPSVSRHYSAESPDIVRQRFAPWQIKGLVRPVERLEDAAFYHAIHHSLYFNHPSWEAAYRFHEGRVLRFFAGERAERLLRIDVTSEPSPWERLCAFVGRPVPDSPFPRKRLTPVRPPGVSLSRAQAVPPAH